LTQLSDADSAPRRRGKLIGRFVFGLVVIVLIGSAALALWFGNQQWQEYRGLSDQRRAQLEDLDRQDKAATQSRAAFDQRLQSQQDGRALLLERFDGLQLRVDAQASRLAELGSTSRTDWLLAEAAYLARLANQRLYAERSTANPLALLASIDSIFRDLDNPQFLSVRAALVQDMASLKRFGDVDIDGLYLQLDSLGRQLQTLDTWPLAKRSQTAPTAAAQRQIEPVVADASAWQTVVERRNLPIVPLLDDRQEGQLKVTLGRLVAQAQAALLSQRPNVFRLSLSEARRILQAHFPDHSDSRLLAQQLSLLADRPIVQPLSTIDGSLRAIDAALALRRQHLELAESVE